MLCICGHPDSNVCVCVYALIYSLLQGGVDVDIEPPPELEDPLEPATTAKYLWVKSLTRIRTQVCLLTVNH